MEQYCDIVGIIKPVDRVRWELSRLEYNVFTWWHHLTNYGDEYKFGKLVWSDSEAEMVSTFSDVDCELRLNCQLSGLS